MPHGFFTVEQWVSRDARPRWKPILHLDSHQSLSKAIAALEKLGKPGLFRVMQTQRCIWAEMEHGKLRLHGSHVSAPESLAELAKLFEHEKGRRPVEKARQDRARAKRSRSH
jgi:hypothetical protein